VCVCVCVCVLWEQVSRVKEREEKVKRSADKQKKGRKNRDVLEKEDGSINLFHCCFTVRFFCSRWQQMEAGLTEKSRRTTHILTFGVSKIF